MAKEKSVSINIDPINIKTARVRIESDTPLIVHAWSEKAKRMMLESQQGKKIAKKKARDPFDDFAQALYWLTPKPENEEGIITPEAFDEAIRNGARFGFPVTAIKQGANAAAYRMGWVKNQMQLRGSYFLRGIGGENGMLAEIKGSVPKMREDMVKVGMGTADLRYRPIFENWYIDLEIEYNASGDITLESIISCLNAGGYVCGLGEWRPEKDGDFGRYHVAAIK